MCVCVFEFSDFYSGEQRWVILGGLKRVHVLRSGLIVSMRECLRHKHNMG